MNNKGKILATVAAGIAAGSILGILFAPDKGCATRRKIADQGKKIADGLKENFAKCKEKLSDFKEELS